MPAFYISNEFPNCKNISVIFETAQLLKFLKLELGNSSQYTLPRYMYVETYASSDSLTHSDVGVNAVGPQFFSYKFVYRKNYGLTEKLFIWESAPHLMPRTLRTFVGKKTICPSDGFFGVDFSAQKQRIGLFFGADQNLVFCCFLRPRCFFPTWERTVSRNSAQFCIVTLDQCYGYQILPNIPNFLQ
jgi:hypothetical protein